MRRQEESSVRKVALWVWGFCEFKKLLSRLDKSAKQKDAPVRVIPTWDKRISWCGKGTTKNNFVSGDTVLLSANSKSNKRATRRIGQGRLNFNNSATNYLLSFSCRCKKSQNYQVNILNPYGKSTENLHTLTPKISRPGAMQNLQI